jgi:hypothetical protein
LQNRKSEPYLTKDAGSRRRSLQNRKVETYLAKDAGSSSRFLQLATPKCTVSAGLLAGRRAQTTLPGACTGHGGGKGGFQRVAKACQGLPHTRPDAFGLCRPLIFKNKKLGVRVHGRWVVLMHNPVLLHRRYPCPASNQGAAGKALQSIRGHACTNLTSSANLSKPPMSGRRHAWEWHIFARASILCL